MRAINEDDVKRLIRAEKRNWILTQFPGVTEALNHVEGGLVGIRTVESQIPRWISVEERLPKIREKVVITDGVHTWDYGEFSGLCGKDGQKDRWYWKHNTYRNVKWWMPKKTAFPEPPKEE